MYTRQSEQKENQNNKLSTKYVINNNVYDNGGARYNIFITRLANIDQFYEGK